MKIKNISNSIITIQDLPGAQGGAGLILPPGAEALIYDEDAEKSTQLASLMTAGLISKMSAAEPSDGGINADASQTELLSLNDFTSYFNVHIKDFLIDLRSWVLSNDVLVQFTGGLNGLNGVGTNNYAGPIAGVSVPLVVTDGDGTTDILNSVSFVTISISGGTAAGAKIDGGAGPVTKLFVRGQSSVVVSATSAGTVTLALSAASHPSQTLNAADTASVTLS